MAQHPLSASRIVATAEDIVSADHQFLMSTGTLVHHETFNIEAIRHDLEQLIAERGRPGVKFLRPNARSASLWRGRISAKSSRITPGGAERYPNGFPARSA